MTFQPPNTITDFLPENYEWAEEPADFNYQINRRYRQISSAVNNREIANYQIVTPDISGNIVTSEALTGQDWFNTNATNVAQPRITFRKVINYGTLPNTATVGVPHGVAFDANYTMTRIYGAATDPVAFTYIPLPYADIGAIVNNIALFADATNVYVAAGINRTNFTRCVIVLEYLKNT